MSNRRYAMAVRLKDEKRDFYIKNHSNVWPEVISELKKVKVKNYSIFLKDDFMFGYLEYEGKNFAKNLNSKFIKFKKPKLGSKNQYTFNNLQIILEKTKTFEKLTKNDYSTSIAILDGSLVDNRNQRVISAGEIIKTSTLKILSKF